MSWPAGHYLENSVAAQHVRIHPFFAMQKLVNWNVLCVVGVAKVFVINKEEEEVTADLTQINHTC